MWSCDVLVSPAKGHSFTLCAQPTRLAVRPAQMVELASKKFVCIVDESKLVSGLGGSKGGSPLCTLDLLRA